MRKDKFNLVLDELRYDLIVFSLIELKNKLTIEGRYTDDVVGAIIAGPTGAVVGALSAVDKNMKNKK